MRNQVLTVTAAQLNTGDVIELGLSAQIPYEKQREQFREVLPSEMRVYNRSGCDIEYLLLTDDTEYGQYQINTPLFSFLKIFNGMWVHHHPLEESRKLLIRKVTGTATNDLEIELVGYVNRGH